MTYEFKTKPFDHQLALLKRTWNTEWFGIFWEQGTCKTKVIIDNGCALYQKDMIDCLLVTAPNGVHRNWVDDEIPIHLPEKMERVTHTFLFESDRKDTQWHKKAVREAIEWKGFLIFVMTYDVIRTALGHKALWEVLKKRTCLHTLDESSRIGHPGTKITKRILASARYSKFRRILDGTPADTPFRMYSQMKFLERSFWKEHGLDSYVVFRHFFGHYVEVEKQDGGTYPQLTGFKNLPEMREIIAYVSDRVLKKDVLDLPDKLYTRQYFEMTPEQCRMYDEMRDDFCTEIDGKMIYGEIAIVRMLRWHQISCGYVPVEKGEPEVMIPGGNPRLDLMRDILENTSGKMIVWNRFTMDGNLLMDQCRDLDINAVRYDGTVDNNKRTKNKRSFQEGDVSRGDPRIFVAKASSAGRGLTLTAGGLVTYYSQDYHYINRAQSEDRSHRQGTKNDVLYTDLVGLKRGKKTIDHHIIKNLVTKDETAAIINGDSIRSWL